MRERRWVIPFLDLSNVLFFWFAAMFAIALAVIADAATTAKIDTTSHYLITLKWQDGSKNDIDLSIKTPSGKVAWYKAHEADFASLDHDNLGVENTSAVDGNGKIVSVEGRDEIIYIRQVLAGTYTVNVNYYGGNGQREPVTVVMTYHQVVQRLLTLTEIHEEQTAFQFTIDDQGHISTDTNAEELFINEMRKGSNP